MKSIATRLETVSTCEAPPSLPLEKFHAKIPPFEKYFATILIADLDSRKIRWKVWTEGSRKKFVRRQWEYTLV